ncbi:phosphate ABC transporter substrate-binding protein [Anaeromyxobacter paludicola]|uniref:Phosphate ABC transporter substrate-binding protein n=1 Tax=Anaeromyxobacter paludicola TaxID=2918171 RepID=A0ABN6N2C5_9BACT|nr:phosphate ABC transporter substrate-binding protein [Anaeromyxobacter paludicola]BDG07328.1 phosphate ABC transporter substrate-binding protein [Anaeromyxobacter paludicola]
MSHLRSLRALAAAVTAAAALTSGASAAAEELTYDGATSIAGKIMKEAVPRFEQKSGVKFARVGTSGAGKGLKAALAGEVSVAGVSRALTPDELGRRPHFQIIGYDALGVFVSQKNPVKVLTKAQLKGIYTGKIKNWKEVGGANLPIVACSEPVNSGRATVDAFRATVLDGDPYGAVKELDDASDCVKLIAGNPAALGPATMAYSATGVRAIPLDGIMPSKDDIRAGTYLLSRPLLLVSRARPTGALKQFYDFMLSPEGQQIVAKSFVPVR